MEPSGAPHEAWFLILAYLPLQELISVSQVCKSFRDAINDDILIWLDIIVEKPLSFCLTDEILMKIASKANGRLRNLALLDCARITDAGLMSVVYENPLISKLYVPGCTELTPEGLLAATTVLTERSDSLTTLKINGIYNLTQDHLQVLKSNLPNIIQRNPRFYHKYINSSFRTLDEETRPLDVEICPKCKEVRLVFDCPKKTCGKNRCQGCTHCIPRCEGCGGCLGDADDEQGETICRDYLCLDCWLCLPKCNLCNKPFCPRHAKEGDSRMGSDGFVCEDCEDAAIIRLIAFESLDKWRKLEDLTSWSV